MCNIFSIHNILSVLASTPKKRQSIPRAVIFNASPAKTAAPAAPPSPRPLTAAGPPTTADRATNCMVPTSSSVVFRIATCLSQIMTNAASSLKNRG